MADKIVTDFLNTVKSKSRKAMDWFRSIVGKTRSAAFPASTGRKEIMGGRNIGITRDPEIGKMYLFQYEAKLKDTKYKVRSGPNAGSLVHVLPYWDRWPLIFPFDHARGGFYGINLHYLPVGARIELMTALMKAQGESNRPLDKDYNLTLSYNIIKGFKPAKRCIKRYLRTHLQTSLYGITGEDWSYAAALPLQKFEGPQPW